MANRYRDRGPNKANWMKNFEDHVTKLAPEHHGKIDWDTAHYHYFQKHDPQHAAEKYVSVRKKPTNESYKIHYPSLKKLSELEYVDPRVNTDGRRICVEKEGNFRKGDRNIAGHYVVYEDIGFPGSYIGVHIGNELSEDDGQVPINVVAIDPSRSSVVNRVAYRARQSKIAESEAIITNESREISLMKNMREVLDESKRPVRFRELTVGDKFRFADDDEILVKVSATHYKCNGVKYGMPNKSELVIKEGVVQKIKNKYHKTMINQ